MKNLSLIYLVLICLVTYSCKKEVAGCMDIDSMNYNEAATMDDGSCLYLEDSFTGEWEVRKFLLNGNDLVELNILRFSFFEFEENGDFKWTGDHDFDQDGNFRVLRGEGAWKVDPKELTITGDLDILCTGLDDFEYDFDSDQELKIETTCDDGLSIRILLQKA